MRKTETEQQPQPHIRSHAPQRISRGCPRHPALRADMAREVTYGCQISGERARRNGRRNPDAQQVEQVDKACFTGSMI